MSSIATPRSSKNLDSANNGLLFYNAGLNWWESGIFLNSKPPYSFLIIILIVILPAIRGLRLGVRLRAGENELHFNLNDTGIGKA